MPHCAAMTFQRRLKVIAVLASVASTAFVVGRSSTVPRAEAATTYSTTIVGSEVHGLDPHIHPKSVDGGGSIPTYDGDTPAPPWFAGGRHHQYTCTSPCVP